MEVQNLSDKHLPVKIWPQSVEAHVFPPKLTFRQVKIIPKAELKSQIRPFTLKKVSFSLNMWTLFLGEFRIQNVVLQSADIKGVIDNKYFEASENNKRSFDFKFLESFPIDNILLDRINLLFKTSDDKYAGNVDKLRLEFNNLRESLRIHVSAQRIQLKELDQSPILSFFISTNFVVSPKDIIVTALKLKKGRSYLVGTSQIKGDILNLKLEKIEAKIKSELFFNELALTARTLFPNEDIPKIVGSSQIEFEALSDFSNQIKANYKIKSRDLKIMDYQIGDNEITGNILNNTVHIQTAFFRNVAGKAEIDDLSLDLANNNNFNLNFSTKKLEVAKLLQAINISNVPVEAAIAADLPCFGSLKPQPQFTCKGTAEVSGLTVWDDMNKKFTIVKLSPGQLVGQFNVNEKRVKYESDIRINSSTGTSAGTINYEKGFDIKFDGILKNISKNIIDLANLKIEGATKVSGRTWGDSSWGKIDAKFGGRKMWLEDFGLGNPNFQLQYAKGTLHFKNISSKFGLSRFKGSFDLDLLNNKLTTKIDSPFLDVQDVQSLLSRKANLPFKLKGTGSAKISASGPLQINRMNYNLDATIFRGTVADETFDQATINLESKKGYVASKKISIVKAESEIKVKGTVDPKGQLDAIVLGERFRLEQSEFLGKLGLNMGGQLDFTMAMRGPVLSPSTELHGRLSNTIIADLPEPDSSFWLRFNNSSIEGRGKFIGNTVQTEFRIPYVKSEPFRFYLKSHNWNFANLFSMLSGSDIQNAYQATLSTEINLDSPSNWIWQSSGFIKIPKLLLKKGEHYLQNSKTMEMTVENGKLSNKFFRMEGPSSFLEFKPSTSSRESIDLTMSGKFDLSLVSLFTPFLENLRGVSSVNLSINGSANDPNMLGSAYIQGAFIKLKGLVHPFEDLTGDLLLNQKSLLINTLKSSFGNGILTANGKVNFAAKNGLPVNIKGQFQKVELNVPSGFKTQGSGTLNLKGNQFPYILAINYNVTDGNINANLLKESENQQRIQPSDFLPKFLAEETLDPIHLDLNIDLLRPLPVIAILPEAKVNTRVDGNLRVLNSPTKPILKGIIKSQPGGILEFRSNNFDINSAVLEYNNSPPENPTISVSATANIKTKPQSGEISSTTEEYEVTLDIQGPAKNLSIDLNSQPTLSETDIVSLLAFGVTSSQSQALDSDQQALQSGLEVGAQLVKQKLGISKAFENTIGFDFNISSVLDDETAAPKYGLSRQFTPKFGMSMSRTEGKTPKYEMNLEYKFNHNFSGIVNFESKEASSTDDNESTSKSQEKVGLDLEYKFQFK